MYIFKMFKGNQRHGKNHTRQALEAQLANVHRFISLTVVCVGMLPERCKLLAAVWFAHRPLCAFNFVKA